MKIQKQYTEAGQCLVTLEGNLDAACCDTVRPVFLQLTEHADLKTVRLDLSEVDFLDSSGIGAIVFLWKRLRQSGRALVLIGPKGQPASLLDVLKIGKSIPIEEYS